jgi:hypothetical protein
VGKLRLNPPGDPTSKDPRKPRAEHSENSGTSLPNEVANQPEGEPAYEENGKGSASHSDDEMMSEDSDADSDEGEDAMKMEVDPV